GVADAVLPITLEVQIRVCERHVVGEGQGAAVDTFGEALRSRTAMMDIVFHPKVGLDAPRVVAGAQHQAAEGAVAANHGRHRWGREQTTAPHQHAPKTIGRGEAYNALDGGAVVVTPIPSHYEGLACQVD